MNTQRDISVTRYSCPMYRESMKLNLKWCLMSQNTVMAKKALKCAITLTVCLFIHMARYKMTIKIPPM